ncbi:MAG: flavin reductase family protein [Caulobacteraceae bacterium]|nr:flavin reductase family protein [Caulobacter sp.]
MADGSGTDSVGELAWDGVRDADFKAAMRKLAATVTLVTTCEEGVRFGMAATAVCSLSAEPASLLVCINQRASLHGPTTRTRFFCVNLLRTTQAELFGGFTARRGQDRFAVGSWRPGHRGLPYMEDAAAAIFCAVEQETHYGTHTIFVGRIERLIMSHGAEPLVFQDGAMGRVERL